MTRYVAFLGGINVGGHRVSMERLRTEFGTLGFLDVSTFIASGNVIFTTRTTAHTSRRSPSVRAVLGSLRCRASRRRRAKSAHAARVSRAARAFSPLRPRATREMTRDRPFASAGWGARAPY